MAAIAWCGTAMDRNAPSRPRSGLLRVRRAKVRDRADVAAEEKIRFTSSILPKWVVRDAIASLPSPQSGTWLTFETNPRSRQRDRAAGSRSMRPRRPGD
jgi:hypothetical protein